jgi:hypothetical protein
MPKALTGRLVIVPEEEEVGYEEGLATPLCMCTPEDRAAWKEEHMTELLRQYGMTPAEAAMYIYFATRLEDD